MAVAPPECTRDHSQCRISEYNHRSASVTQTPIYDGNGVMVSDPVGPAQAAHDCVCATCGLMWTEDPLSARLSATGMPGKPTITNVHRAGG